MIKRFLSYVEIQTKITSLFAFAMGLGLLYTLGGRLDPELTLLFFGSMFLFDLTTTAINNYIDTRTNGLPLQFSRPVALAILLVLLAVSALLGLMLAWRTDLVVLAVGGLCFLCGVFYTFGPVPVSRIPLGEVLSGTFYGLLIPFLLLYINLPEGSLLSLGLSGGVLSLDFRLAPLLTLGLACWLPMVCTANIMLANNICDLQKDIAVGRHTLPYYFGRERSVALYGALYYSTALAVLLPVATGQLPPPYLLALIPLIFVRGRIAAFRARQVKSETFVTSIQSFILLMSGQCLALAACGVWTQYEIF